jgi:hypothetical protein
MAVACGGTAPALTSSVPQGATIRAWIMRLHKKLRPEDDDVRAWVIIGLIFCAVALAVWIPVVVERHFIQ